jgi:L-rhamnose mutarotase
MERFAWKGRIKPGMQAEYKRRHDAIWPEMKALLKQAGIRNYTIWSDGDVLFGYYECENGIAFAEKTQAGSPIVDRWNVYMQDVLELEMDPQTGAQPKMQQMFLLE